MQILESAIERECRRWVAAHHGILLKIQGAKGWPDRLLVRKDGKMAFIEFKRPGRQPDELQAYILHKLNAMGAKAFWVTSVEEFKEVYNGL